uniref:PsbP C-terminal domain-containing protein n=1 Tax=Chromera velia CCMP2878 TaxID=1169474 RepID=A0A0G4HZ24_9ALVE|eukprot:Cvel_1565.t1-p1 / transcript=Cvel_1565.t1 / gene=Cvel_1565 / organism=Chromera_velia_CCMP2878 / gene_product=hypothetical protein / transcript_product=hypothetical protein / location=Cvel_scaffold55:147006-152730(+) / protein_length=370 / sequence_SO=supercontig / SO=protein_coding / is_pseudo=false
MVVFMLCCEHTADGFVGLSQPPPIFPQRQRLQRSAREEPHYFPSRRRGTAVSAEDKRKPDDFLEEFDYGPWEPLSTRRFLIFQGLGLAAALGGNLYGVTSGLLQRAPEGFVEASELDVIFGVRGLRRYIDRDNGFEFLRPEKWLLDQALYYAKEEERRREAAKAEFGVVGEAADSLIGGGEEGAGRAKRRRRGRGGLEVAFGPAGSDPQFDSVVLQQRKRQGGYVTENVSVARTQIATAPDGTDFFDVLGPPEEAARKLIAASVAPPGSGKEFEFLEAHEEVRPFPQMLQLPGPFGNAGATRGEGPPLTGRRVYSFEYIVRGANFRAHSLSVVAVRDGELFTLTVVVPDEVWEQKAALARSVADSFRLRF